MPDIYANFHDDIQVAFQGAKQQLLDYPIVATGEPFEARTGFVRSGAGSCGDFTIYIGSEVPNWYKDKKPISEREKKTKCFGIVRINNEYFRKTQIYTLDWEPDYKCEGGQYKLMQQMQAIKERS